MPRRSLVVRIFVTAMACVLVATTGAQAFDVLTERRSDKTPALAAAATALPFEPTEELVFDAEFSKLVLRGVKIAEFKFTAARAPANASTAPASSINSTPNADAAEREKAAPAPLLFTGDIISRGWFRKLFGINFHYRVESVVEPDGFKILRTTKLDEQGKRVRTSEAVFDRVRNSVSWTERDPNDATRPPRIVNSPLQGATHDIITAIYFLRTQTLTPGQTFELVLSDSGRVFQIPARVLAEKKKMKSIVGKVAVVRVDVEMFGEGRLVQDDGRMSIWFTDDARRLPVRARISSNPGTLDITLKSIKKQ